MKKIVVVLVSAVALLAVIVVAFFGTRAVGIIPQIYIESVAIRDMYGHAIDATSKTLSISFSSDDIDAEGSPIMYYLFNAEILPENATSRSILYYCSPNTYFSWATSEAVAPEMSVSGSEAGSVQTSRTGQLIIKKMERKDPAKPVYQSVQITLRADDNGTAPSNRIWFVVAY